MKKINKNKIKIIERDRGAAAVLLNLRRYEVWLNVAHSLRVFFSEGIKICQIVVLTLRC